MLMEGYWWARYWFIWAVAWFSIEPIWCGAAEVDDGG